MIYLKAALAVAVITACWLAIELSWRRVFNRDDNPRLAGCRGCSSCTCADKGEDARGLDGTANDASLAARRPPGAAIPPARLQGAAREPTPGMP